MSTVEPVRGAAAEPFRRYRLSVAEYQRLGEADVLAPDARVELIEGEIIDMAPIGGAHVNLVNRLASALFVAVGEGGGERKVVSVQNPVLLGETSQPQPDIAVLAATDERGVDDLPRAEDVLLAVEVADTTLAYDRDVKLPLYARHGIPEVWLVDVRAGRLTVHREPGPDGYRDERTPALADVSPPWASDAPFDLSRLFD